MQLGGLGRPHNGKENQKAPKKYKFLKSEWSDLEAGGRGLPRQETERGHASWDLSREVLLARATRSRPRVSAHKGQRSGPAHKVNATQDAH